MKDANLCPIKDVESRLLDALRLWLETEKNYFDPDGFRLSLNNNIQALRNVTFILQKNKDKISSFDTWYNQWQDRMRGDIILKWLVQARNFIVKQGDLATDSLASIGVVNSWYEPLMTEIGIDPLVNTSDFAYMIALKVPSVLQREGNLLKVERKWVDKNLPQTELLEALAHSYEVLSSLLMDAHKHLSDRVERGIRCEWYENSSKAMGLRPDFMISPEWTRTIWLDLCNFTIMYPQSIRSDISDETLKAAADRYPGLQMLANRLKQVKSLRTEAEVLFDHAKTVLKKDGYHIPIALLVLPNNKRIVCELSMNDRSEKHLVYRKLASEMEKQGATSLFLITEAWFAIFDDKFPSRHAVDAPEKKEVLQLIAADIDGNIFSKQVFFRKEKGNVILEDEFELTDESNNFLAPIKDMWKRQRAKVNR